MSSPAAGSESKRCKIGVLGGMFHIWVGVGISITKTEELNRNDRDQHRINRNQIRSLDSSNRIYSGYFGSFARLTNSLKNWICLKCPSNNPIDNPSNTAHLIITYQPIFFGMEEVLKLNIHIAWVCISCHHIPRIVYNREPSWAQLPRLIGSLWLNMST